MTQSARARKPTKLIASGSSSAQTSPSQPTQRGMVSYRNAASDTATTSRPAAIAPLARSRSPASSKRRRVFGSSWNSSSIAAKAVARETAFPASMRAVAIAPPTSASDPRVPVSSRRAINARSPSARTRNESAAAVMRKNAATSRARCPLSA
jgi:hypothetical protein